MFGFKTIRNIFFKTQVPVDISGPEWRDNPRDHDWYDNRWLAVRHELWFKIKNKTELELRPEMTEEDMLRSNDSVKVEDGKLCIVGTVCKVTYQPILEVFGKKYYNIAYDRVVVQDALKDCESIIVELYKLKEDGDNLVS